MRALRRFVRRLGSLIEGQRREERLREEFEEHLALQTEENMLAGMPRAEARRQAVLKFGAIEAMKESYRAEGGLPSLESMVQDTRYALRQLRKTPTFTITAALTLALGIGATTAIFTVVHAVMLRSLPVANPDQLYRLGKEPHCCVWGGYNQNKDFSIVSYELYQYLRDHTKGFEELAAFQADGTLLGVRRVRDARGAESYFGEFVSGNYFQMFGIHAFAGRTLTNSDDQGGAPPTAVMSYRVWQEKFGLDPSVIGTVFRINNVPFTMVGVTPPSFYGDTLKRTPPDFFLPLPSEPLVQGDSSILRKPDAHWLDVIGRIQPGAKVSAVEAQMRIELQHWLRSHWGDMNANERLGVPSQTTYLSPGGAGITSMREEYKRWLQILMMVSGFVLLIVCANLANLMLVRGIERRQQTSLSMALGARPARLVRQVLTEGVLLSLLGGAFGLAVAYGGTRLILHFAFESLSAVPISASPSIPVLLFAFGVSLATGIVFGIAPAWMATHTDPVEALRGANRSTRHTGSLPRRSLVVVQAAVSLVLLSAAGLLSATLRNLEHQNFGFEQEHRMVVSVDPVLANYKPEELETLYRRIHEAFVNIPGVVSVASALYSPFSGESWNDWVYIEGKPAPGPDAEPLAWLDRVSPGYFQTIGNRIIAGRAIDERDTARSQHVAVINEAFARKFFKNENSIGKHFGREEMKNAGDYEVVGVARDAQYVPYYADKPVLPIAFLPESQSSQFSRPLSIAWEIHTHYLHDIVIRMAPGATLSEAMARRALASVDPNLPMLRMRTIAEQVASVFSQQRLIAHLTSLFGILALVLASIGIYGMSAYNAGSRTNEIGVRMALGADRGDVVALILKGAFLLISLGLLVGVPLTLVAGRLLGHQLYGLNAYDPVILLTAVGVLGLCAFVAAVIPAMRASSISPFEALRAE